MAQTKYLDYTGLKKVIDWAKGSFVRYSDDYLTYGKKTIDSLKMTDAHNVTTYFNFNGFGTYNNRNQRYEAHCDYFQLSGLGFTNLQNSGKILVCYSDSLKPSIKITPDLIKISDKGQYDVENVPKYGDSIEISRNSICFLHTENDESQNTSTSFTKNGILLQGGG